MSDQVQAVGVGSPAVFYLHEFGRLVHTFFGEFPFLVGSALKGKNPRDIDVRVRINEKKFRALFDDITACGGGSRYAVVCMAFSALGEKMIGLPVDFQIQHPSWFNKFLDQPRLELGRDTANGSSAA
jgi:hypothetical protein